ncbi:hypothetical protein [Streptomyces sp. MBT62]|uniref:hypothetical protein n=1 Tax=Streptomyces sp. MBT62 TaxID=2800410 RepID=UPI00190AAB4E|nr:hypothetical protein [Streptomyces sp. MBT62]MBK3564922.1 hypothetical protein [Streptomyces sp. MBT62]
MVERLARQLRPVGAALAWRALGFRRLFILALCHNDLPDPMHGKAGQKEELDHPERGGLRATTE